MKWTKLYGAVVAMLGMVGTANAGSILLTGCSCGGAEKSCGCAPSCQPQSCRPVICRPSCPKVCTYQRSCCKPGSCGMTSNGCGPKACAPAATCAAPAACAPAPAACAPAPATCAAPAACAPAPATCAAPAACAPAPATCAAPAACAPAPATCAAPAPVSCGPAPATCAAPAPVTCGPAPVTCGPAPAKCCDTGCQQKNNCCADPCEVAHWIYESQTACYAKCRRNALKKLGKYECNCNPEIMCAFAYGLNDAVECVRKEAAVQIRKQTKCHPECCNCKVVAALTCALADCDKGVRREAEKALCACGYDVKDCCDKPSCGTGCGTKMACAPANCAAPSACGTQPMTTPAPAEGGETAPAPAPAPAAAEPEAYFPSRLKNQQTKARKSGLANLFGLRG